ncbi:integrase catalytic domain-containing protein [Trichonephila clavipes]|nr:integrase catalytic domain-containing protein [Trichonephila clavipes]
MLDTCLYVDDIISGADDISQALKESKDAKTIMKNASMKLRKWNSNDQTLMRTWTSAIGHVKTHHKKELCFNQLGKYTIQLGSCHPTQLGSNAYYKNFGYGKLKIPRKILDSSGDSSEVQIHTFSDASQKAYGAVAFLRVKHKDRVSVDLVTSKSRVAPLKRLSLPRLELMGALIAARLAKEVKKILDQKCSTRAFFWTDSQVTLHWIKGPSHRWKPFVANRVREIQSLTDPNSWFHCSGKDNPADLLTRGISVDALTTNSKWWNGSSFLRQIDFQTKGLDEAIPERVYLTEMRKNSNPKEDISLTLTVTKNNFLENIIDISNNYVKLIRVVSFLLQIHTQLQNQNYKDKGTPYFTGGTLVLIKDENLPSTKWSTGRITEIFPGADENAGNAATSKLTREMGIQRADSKRGGRRSRAEKKSDENSDRIRTHHSLFTRQTCRSLSTTKYQRVL